MSAKLEELVIALGEPKVFALLRRAALADASLTPTEKKLLLKAGK